MSALPMDLAQAALPDGAPAAAHTGAAPWCLRFTSGAMRGRTITLQRGENVLGSAGGCDVMLPGSEVRARHLVFHVGAWAVAVQRQGDAAATFNGQAMTERRRGLVAGDRIGVGTIELALDRVQPPPEGPDSMFEPDPQGAAPALDAPAAPAGTSHARGWRMAAAFAAAFALSVLLLWALLGPPGGAGERAAAGDLDSLRRALADFPEVELVAPPGGAMRVAGFVESTLRQQALERVLQPYGPRIELKVQSVDAVVEQARRYIGDPGVAVTYGGKGRLVLSGATESPTSQDKIQRLAQDLHPAVMLADRVQYKPRAAAEAEAGQKALWQNWQSLLPDRVVSITEDADGTRHIQLANGQRYYEGAILKSGAQLKLVKPDELVIAPAPTGGTP